MQLKRVKFSSGPRPALTRHWVTPLRFPHKRAPPLTRLYSKVRIGNPTHPARACGGAGAPLGRSIKPLGSSLALGSSDRALAVKPGMCTIHSRHWTKAEVPGTDLLGELLRCWPTGAISTKPHCNLDSIWILVEASKSKFRAILPGTRTLCTLGAVQLHLHTMPGCCSVCVTLLRRKEALLKANRCCSSICEILIPILLSAIVLVGALISDRDKFPTELFVARQLDDRISGPEPQCLQLPSELADLCATAPSLSRVRCLA
jgi:hypothetical protein